MELEKLTVVVEIKSYKRKKISTIINFNINIIQANVIRKYLFFGLQSIFRSVWNINRTTNVSPLNFMKRYRKAEKSCHKNSVCYKKICVIKKRKREIVFEAYMKVFSKILIVEEKRTTKYLGQEKWMAGDTPTFILTSRRYTNIFSFFSSFVSRGSQFKCDPNTLRVVDDCQRKARWWMNGDNAIKIPALNMNQAAVHFSSDSVARYTFLTSDASH